MTFDDLLFRALNEDFARIQEMGVVHLPGNDSHGRPVSALPVPLPGWSIRVPHFAGGCAQIIMLIGRSVPGTDMAAMMDLFAYMIGEAEKVAKGECVPTSWAARDWPGPPSCASPLPHPHQDWTYPLPHLHRDRARPLPHPHWAHLPHLHPDWAHPRPHLHRDSHRAMPPIGTWRSTSAPRRPATTTRPPPH